MAIVKTIGAWFLFIAGVFAFVFVISWAGTHPDNPYNKAWAMFVCGNYMTDEERAAEPRCP